VARKLLYHITWSGIECKIFNVGRYRRAAYAETLQQSDSSSSSERDQKGLCDANFFDAHNEQAAAIREKAAEMALNDMLHWLDGGDDGDNNDEDDSGGESEQPVQSASRHSSVSYTSSSGPKLDFQQHERIAIFDATNSTHKRRQWILEQCTSPHNRPGKPTGVVFVESICDDTELLNENFRHKVLNSPDYEGVTPEEAMNDLRVRVQKYEEQYQTITDDSLSYIKIFNLSTKLLVNHIYGRMAKELVPAFMAWHIGSRPIFLCRPGQTISGILTDGEDYVARSKVDPHDPRFLDMSATTKRKVRMINYKIRQCACFASQFTQFLIVFLLFLFVFSRIYVEIR
jgi:6-phosphofructo-2-kinase / fructose-2,6-biphosphatase 2